MKKIFLLLGVFLLFVGCSIDSVVVIEDVKEEGFFNYSFEVNSSDEVIEELVVELVEEPKEVIREVIVEKIVVKEVIKEVIVEVPRKEIKQTIEIVKEVIKEEVENLSVVVVEKEFVSSDQIIDGGFVDRVPLSSEAPRILKDYGREMNDQELGCQRDCLNEEFQYSGLSGVSCWCGYLKGDGTYLKFLLRE